MSDYPYQDRFPVQRTLPEHGRPRDEILAELATHGEGGGRLLGDRQVLGHHVLRRPRALRLPRPRRSASTRHVNVAAARHVPELDALRGRDHRHDARPASTPRRSPTPRPPALDHERRHRQHLPRHARLPRATGTHAASPAPTSIKPETAHPAFDKACHLFGIELRKAPIDPDTTLGRRRLGRATTSTTRHDRPHRLGRQLRLRHRSTRSPSWADLALEHGIGLHVDGCLGGFILPWGQELGYDIPLFDFRLPGVTTISADTHKYGYALKGTSVLLFRDKALRNSQYFFLTDWSGGKYCSPGIDGSRSGGLLAATWASMVSLGREGYRSYAKAIFETVDAHAGRRALAIPSCGIMGTPTFCFCFTCDEFDIYHVNDFMRRAWLALQRPAVPELDPHGRHPPADPARRRRRSSPPTSPRPSPTPRSTPTSRRRAARSTAASPAA